ncbi:MAG TPA: ABC transporter permease [Burkholderiaceae bacterium]|nr:ABC transporter permease [Burkholderiaceae bacterium]
MVMLRLAALDRKLLRDLRALWSQALTIALVVASGVAGFVTTLSAVDSLEQSRERFYQQARFADVFAVLRRAPMSAVAGLQQIPGVAEVQVSVEFDVRVSLPGRSDPIVGHLIGLDANRPLRLNRLTLRSGAAAEPGANSPGRARSDGALPVWVSEVFAKAHGLKSGALVSALINGRQRSLVVSGIALSPEYIFAGLWGMPDQRGFGVFWVDADALAASYDMQASFNRVAIRLAPGAGEQAVIDELQRQLERFGARSVYGRHDQTSHAMLDNEIKEQQTLGRFLPAIFMAVAAFLLHVVIMRLVSTQREQIAALKALGYPNQTIALHYLKLVGVIVLLGMVLGLIAGKVLGTMLVGLYQDFFRFPELTHVLSARLMLLALSVTAATALLGTLNAIAATVRLAPAEAMRPPAPGRYRPTLLERAGLVRMGTALRMILRNIERRPLRSSLSVAGVAAAVAIVILGNFFRDAIDYIVDGQFNRVMRNDIAVWTLEPVQDHARLLLGRLPGVRAVEASRYVPVTLVHGHRRERTQIRGLDAQPDQMRIIDADNRPVNPDEGGLLLTDRLATKLGLRPGDMVRVEVLEGDMRTVQIPVVGTVRETMGLNAYMERRALNRAVGDGDLSTGFVLSLERGREDEVLEATREMPLVAGAFSKATMLRNMQELSARNIRVISTVLTVFAVVIAVGVVYNNARIALAERTWELASLRVLGFSRAEVSALLLGELALIIALALPVGMWLGLGLVHALTEALKSDAFYFPVVIQARTYAWAALTVTLAGLASAMVVQRRINRLDMVAALKTRE